MIAGCGPNDEPAPTRPAASPRHDGKLVYGVEFDANTWSPFVDRWLQSGLIVAQAFYEPLATFDQAGAVVPYLAESITGSDGWRRWTIRLRPDITFHDGLPLDATAVKANFDKHGAGTDSNFSPLFGVAAVDIADDRTVIVRTHEPWASFPVHLTGQLGNQAGYMASPKMIAADDPHALPVGTGPFVADEWRRDNHISGKRNTTYWRTGMPYLDAIEFRFDANDDTRAAALERGDIDVLAAAGGRVAGSRVGRAGVTVTRQNSDPLQRMIVLNTAVAPLDDIRVRRALWAALDCDRLVAEVGDEGARASDSPFPVDSPWYRPPTAGGHAPETARALLAERAASGGQPVAIELVGWSSPDVVRLQQLIAEQWRAVGIDVTLTTEEQRAVPVRIAVGRYQAAIFQKFAGHDPDTFTPFFLGAAINPVGAPSLNLARFADPAIDAAVREGRATPDEAQRRASAATVQERLTEARPMLWLYDEPAATVQSSRVRGIGEGALPDGAAAMPYVSGHHGFTHVWLDG